MPVRPTRILIVGGGAGGVITAAALVRRATHDSPTDVHVLERGPVVEPVLKQLLQQRWCIGEGDQAVPKVPRRQNT